MHNTSNYLGQTVSVVMDRPLGSKHPKHGFIYPVNYGYIPNTISGDGEELDAYFNSKIKEIVLKTTNYIGRVHKKYYELLTIFIMGDAEKHLLFLLKKKIIIFLIKLSKIFGGFIFLLYLCGVIKHRRN